MRRFIAVWHSLESRSPPEVQMYIVGVIKDELLWYLADQRILTSWYLLVGRFHSCSLLTQSRSVGFHTFSINNPAPLHTVFSPRWTIQYRRHWKRNRPISHGRRIGDVLMCERLLTSSSSCITVVRFNTTVVTFGLLYFCRTWTVVVDEPVHVSINRCNTLHFEWRVISGRHGIVKNLEVIRLHGGRLKVPAQQ